MGDQNDAILCGYIANPGLIHNLGIDIPKLRQAANNSYIRGEETQIYKTIYTAETSKDYHTLFCMSPSTYTKGLENLMSSLEFEENVMCV